LLRLFLFAIKLAQTASSSKKALLYRALRTRSRRGARALAPGANSQFLLHTVILYQALKKSFGDHYTRDAGLCARVDTGNSL
jgi:hypothetical protein